jgi:hypothetical protein
MADEVYLGNTTYISSKRAARDFGYAQDYVGQLARGGIVDAQRVGGLWYVNPASLEAYKRNADGFAPKPPVAPIRPTEASDTLISFDGKDYISAARAAKLTGYNPDYVGQLARGGKILSRQIGNRWYVERDGLMAHKAQKDALLAAVQAEAVGLQRPATAASVPEKKIVEETPSHFTYFSDDRHLMPMLSKGDATAASPNINGLPAPAATRQIPIRVVQNQPRTQQAVQRGAPAAARSRIPGISMRTAVKATAAITVIIVMSYAITSMKAQSSYAFRAADLSDPVAAVATAAPAIHAILDGLEKALFAEIEYTRP